MPSWKLCPICQTERIFRREVKTCGAPQCIALWRQLSPSQRAKATEQAGENAASLEFGNKVIVQGDLDAVFKSFQQQQQSQQQQPSRPNQSQPPTMPSKFFSRGKTVERDNDFLKKVFGEDAPGVVEPENKDKEDDKEDDK